MKQLQTSLFGSLDPWFFLGLFCWGIVGAYILIQLNANRRDPQSSRTPVLFSWRVWFKDNFPRVIFNLVLIFVFIRFIPDIKEQFPTALGWMRVNEFTALIIGFSSDGLALLLNKFNIVKLVGTYKAPWLGKDPDEYLDKLKDKGIVPDPNEKEGKL